MASIYYQGHGSFRLTSKDGAVLFIDPFIGDGYDQKADVVLITHQHPDHNDIAKLTLATDAVIISEKEALAGGKHNTFTVKGYVIEAVEAGYNAGHTPKDSVGYIITVDGISMYFAGDTSTTPQMATFAKRHLDYAFLPGDGYYNMNLEEACACAKVIQAKHNVPVHLKPGMLYCEEMAESWCAPNKLLIKPGIETPLK